MTGITPDEIVYWNWGFVRVSATLIFTWVVMLVMIGGSWLAIRHLVPGRRPGKLQVGAEIVIDTIRSQIREIAPWDRPDRYLPFVGTLFLFIVVSNLLAIFPGFEPPTASLSTTAALAICVFLAVPVFGVMSRGPKEYLRGYLEPTWLMLPFNLLGEITRTLALAIRLFGNMMSGARIVAILIAIAPLLLPVPFRVLGLLTGLIQAYIFAILAMVYIAAGLRSEQDRLSRHQGETNG